MSSDSKQYGPRKATKKPVEVDYFEWDGTDECAQAIMDWTELIGDGRTFYVGGRFCIYTLEGVMEVSPGDLVIRGVEGEHYPCKPEIFAKTYDLKGDES